MKEERKVEIIEDNNGTRIVLIRDIIFKGRQNIDWRDVRKYLEIFVGDSVIIEETAEKIYIGTDLPNEYIWSKDTARLKGTLAKAKANGAQAIPELVKIAENKVENMDHGGKHGTRAKYGWYRYDARFALPVYSEDGTVERYNVFKVRVLVRHAKNGKKYLYDMVNIKKETSKPHVEK